MYDSDVKEHFNLSILMSIVFDIPISIFLKTTLLPEAKKSFTYLEWYKAVRCMYTSTLARKQRHVNVMMTEEERAHSQQRQRLL